MAISVDPISSPRIITVLAPDTSITIQDLINQIRDWEDGVISLEYPHLANASGKDSLLGAVSVGITLSLQNAKLAFQARAGPTFEQCIITGGNLVAVDTNGDPISPIEPTAFTQVTLAQSSSPTIINADAAALWNALSDSYITDGTKGKDIQDIANLVRILLALST